MSLLAGLAGVDVPVRAGPTTFSGAAADSCPVADRQSLARATTSGGTSPISPVLSPTDREAWLDHLVSRPEPDPELAAQLDAGRLTVRSLYLLLFEAQPRGWGRQRAAAWDALVAAPTQAPGVLSMHTQARAWPPAGYLERNERTAIAFVTTQDGPVVGEPPVAAGIRAARAAAAPALVRDLAPPVAGDNPQDAPKPGGHAPRAGPGRSHCRADVRPGGDRPCPPAGLHLHCQLRPCHRPLHRLRGDHQQERGQGGRRGRAARPGARRRTGASVPPGPRPP